MANAPRPIGVVGSAKQPGMLPEFVGNSIEVVNSLSRIAVKVTHMGEHLVDDMSDVVSILASQQKARLLAEMTAAGYTIPDHLKELAKA